MFVNYKKEIMKYTCYLVVISLLLLLLKNTNFQEIMIHIKNVPLKILVLLLGLQVFTQLLLAMQWHYIVKAVHHHSSFLKTLYILTTGSVIEAITPGAKVGGEVTRVYYLKKEFQCSSDKAANIMLIQKSISMSVLFSICLFSFLSIHHVVKHHFSFWMQGLITGLCLLCIVFMLMCLFYVELVEKVLEKRKSKVCQKLYTWVVSFHHSVRTLSRREWIRQFVISFLVWILFPLKMVILAKAMHIHIPFFVIVGITMTSYMIGMLPLTPGGVGTFEGTLTILLSFISIERAVSICIAIVFRFVTFWFVIIGSALYVVCYKKGVRYVKTL